MPIVRQDVNLRHICKCGWWTRKAAGMAQHVAYHADEPGAHGDLRMLVHICLGKKLVDKALEYQALLEQHRIGMRRQNIGVPERKALIRQMRARDAKAARLSAYMASIGATIGHTAQAKLAEIGLDVRSDEEQCAELLAESDARLDDVNKLFD